MADVGSRILEVRKARQLTQSQFAEELAISQTHVSKIEKGVENPSPTLIRLISVKYNVDEEWLYFGKENNHAQLDFDASLSEQVKKLERLVSACEDDLPLIVDAFDKLVMILTVPNGLKEAQISSISEHNYYNFVRKVLFYMWKLISSVTLGKRLLPTASAKEWLSFKAKSERMLTGMCNSAREATNIFLETEDDIFRI
ncbi:MAG: helix-turn-helix transcriptional regulator [Oscillibacter sp.]|nr:helix-turn-helix transcriptional regulator [Oscillibacter sp.]